MTDAALVLGYLDPDFFLGGAMPLDVETAAQAVAEKVGAKLGLDVNEAAAAVLKLASEHMVRAIEEITLNQGIDPRTAVLIGGGGAAGLNVVAIARRLGCPHVIIPELGAVLSAAGALMCDLSSEYAAMLWTTSTRFDFDLVNATLADLERQCREFAAGPGAGSLETTIEFSAEARYPHQIWELEVPLRVSFFATHDDVEQLRQDFHAMHAEVFAITDAESPIEIVGWRASVRCRLREAPPAALPAGAGLHPPASHRRAYFPEVGTVDAEVLLFDAMEPGVALRGPAIIESPVTTVIIDAGATVERTRTGSLSILVSVERRVPTPV